MYFYIQDNKDWHYEKKVKYGITDDYKNRLKTDQHSYPSEYIYLYEYDDKNCKLNYKEIDNIIKNIKKDNFQKFIIHEYPSVHFEYLFKIKDFLIENGGGTEFMKRDGIELLEKILLEDFIKIGIIVRKIPKEEWDFTNNKYYHKIEDYYKFIHDIYEDNQILYLEKEFDDSIMELDTIKCLIPLYEDKPRGYQEIIIKNGLINIKKDNRVYISLPTGGGKSFISYKIFNELSFSTIIILTPRINICKQNIHGKYLKLLSNTYKIFNKDNLEKVKNDDNNIICCCINSYVKIVEIIKNANLRNIIIWFDEAHYGIENWIKQSQNEFKNFLLEDNEFIKYRLFTSASPNKDVIMDNKHLFGEFMNPFKVRYLMNEGYLCKLEVSISKEEIKDISIESHINLMICNFENKKNGLCFCNSCDNALELFLKHLELYEKYSCIPKPFLLLNSKKIEEYYKEYKIYNVDSKLLKLECFEDEGGIAYVVKMYSMGYDNPKIDFIYFKDPKLSYKDIIQSIGRGLRPYGDKVTDIIIPVYIDNEDYAYRFDRIKEVVKYLKIDVELNMRDINVINMKKMKKKLFSLHKDENDDKEFIENIETIIYEIENMNITKDSITRQLKFNDIHNYNDYLIYIKENPKLNYPEKLFEMFPSFDFNDTYNKNSSPYYSREECIKKIKIYEDDLIFEEEIDKENNGELLDFLIRKDEKIPNECLWFYYGGDKKDFIIFV
jgi:superfamily II DNA or RNA helicase